MKVVLLPVKDLPNAKQRLAPVLSADERRLLTRTMLRDVGSALSACRLADRIVVVGRDPWILQFASERKWDVIAEAEQTSESESVDRASLLLRQQGASLVLRLPGDIPLVRAADIDSLLDIPLGLRSALLVPSRDGTGTNALLRVPPDIFPSRFGRNSFQLHHDEAHRAGATLDIVHNPRISLDLDELSDLVLFLERGQETETFRVIQQMGLSERVAALGQGS